MVQWLDDFGVPPWLRKPPFGFCGFSSKVQEIVFEPNRIAHDIKRYRSWIKWHVPLKLVKIKDIKRIQKVPRVARQGGLSWCFFGLAAIINLGFFLSISAQLSSTPFFFRISPRPVPSRASASVSPAATPSSPGPTAVHPSKTPRPQRGEPPGLIVLNGGEYLVM